MATVKFVLKNPKHDGETLIFMLSRFNNLRLKYSTGEKIHPDYLDAENQRAIITKKKRTKEIQDHNKTINNELRKYRIEIDRIFDNFKAQETHPTIELVRKNLDKRFINTSWILT